MPTAAACRNVLRVETNIVNAASVYSTEVWSACSLKGVWARATPSLHEEESPGLEQRIHRSLPNICGLY